MLTSKKAYCFLEGRCDIDSGTFQRFFFHDYSISYKCNIIKGEKTQGSAAIRWKFYERL
jgi:hypothetical protein